MSEETSLETGSRPMEDTDQTDPSEPAAATQLIQGQGTGMQTKIAGQTIQDRFEKNPLSALKIEDLPPSIISKLRTEPADYIADHNHSMRE